MPARSAISMAAVAFLCSTLVVRTQQASAIPSTPLHYGFFTLTFSVDGAFTLQGQGWPTFDGSWTANKDELTVVTPTVQDCGGRGRYRFRLEGTHVVLTMIADSCEPRRMILHGSTWLPEGEQRSVPARKIVRTGGDSGATLPAAA
jgi:hypothetical protein